jgi:uncharacterized protein (TIRG00374 family)
MRRLQQLKLPMKIVFSSLLLAGIIYYVGPYKLWNRITSVNIAYLPYIFSCYVGVWIAGTINLLILINGTGHHRVRFRTLFPVFLHINSWGFLIPGKLGELSLVPLLRPYNVSIGESTYFFTIDKVISLFLYALLSGILSGILGYYYFGVSLIIVSVVCFSAGAMLGWSSLLAKGANFISKSFLKEHIDAFQKTGRILIRERKVVILKNLLVSIIKLLLQGSIFYLLLKSLDVYVPWTFVIMVTTSLHLASLVPISFSGLGISETIAMFLYGKVGIPYEVSVASALLSNLLSTTLSIIIVIFIKMPSPLEKK